MPVDFVVYFRGAVRAVDLAGSEALPSGLCNRYTPQSAAAAGRELRLMAQTTNFVGNAMFIDSVMDEMRGHLKGKQLGQIFIYGSSSGGRNALDLALKLSANNIFSMSYVALLDAAFFPSETISVPPSTPTFFNVPPVIAFRKENYFQTAGNDSKTSLGQFRTLYTSEMAGEEIHGAVPFFDSKDLTQRVLKPTPVPRLGHTAADEFHGRVIGAAKPTVQSTIAELLDDLIPKGGVAPVPPQPRPLPKPSPGPSPNPGPNPSPRPQLGTHMVVAGDTLSGIALKFYGNANLWPRIYDQNRAVIGPNPNLIRVGQRLSIPA